MPAVVVDIADLAVSSNPDDVLITYSLGSCIAVAIWDPDTAVAGLLHFMLPESQLAPNRADLNPAMFCDTGVPKLFRCAYELGASKERLCVKIAGGAQLLGDNGIFNIGKRNYLALRRVFWKSGVLISATDVGGSVSRSVKINVGSGVVTVKTRTQESVL
jgi:chemotaxis protein CheD